MKDEVDASTRSARKRVSGKKAGKKRCWTGYKPVNGKKAFSKGSCRKA